MSIKRIVSGLLAAGMLACCAAAPQAAPISSLIVEASAASAPKAPEGLKVSCSAAGKAKLKWSKISGADGIEVYVSSSKDGEYKNVKSLSGTKTSVTLSGLTEGKTYYFKLRAYKKSGGKKTYGEYSAIKSGKILTKQEADLAALKSKTPLLASYFELLASGYPLTVDIEFKVKGDYPYKIDTSFGEYGTCNRFRVTIAGEDKFAAKYYLTDGTFLSVIVKGNEMTVLQSSKQLAVKKKLKTSERKDMFNDLLAVKNIPIPDNFTGLKVKNGNKKVDGTEYLYEKLYVDGMDEYRIESFADKKTKELKYLIITLGDASLTYKMRVFSTKIDEGLFSVPSGYKTVKL